MESEFARALDKLSSAESETAAFWQGKCARLEGELERVMALTVAGGAGGLNGVGNGDRRGGGEMQRDRERDRQREREEEREEELRELRRAWEKARDALARRDEEIQGLKTQVRGLKEWVSTSTRADGQAQTSDEVFGEGMARLGNGLQNWVLVNFRRTKIGEFHGSITTGVKQKLTPTDLPNANTAAIRELGRLVPMYEELASTSKIHLLQSVVSRILVELVFDAYFIGLTNEVAGQLKQTEAFLASLGKSLSFADITTE